MLIIIEKSISCSKSRDESSMVHDSSISFGRRHAFEEVMQLVDQVVFLFIERFPLENLFSENFAMVQDLNRWVGITNVWIIFEAEEFLAFRKLAQILVDVHPLFHIFGVFLFAFSKTLHAEVLVLLLFPGKIWYGLSTFADKLHFGLCSSGTASSRSKT